MFKIKNLDTGEEEEIRNHEDSEKFEKKVSQGLSSSFYLISEINQKNPWKQFWLNVEKNNEALRGYCENGLYD